MAINLVCDYCGKSEDEGANFNTFDNGITMRIDTIFGEDVFLKLKFSMMSKKMTEAIGATHKVDGLLKTLFGISQETMVDYMSGEDDFPQTLKKETAEIGTQIKTLTKKHKLVIDSERNEAFLTEGDDDEFIVCNSCIITMMRTLFMENLNTTKFMFGSDPIEDFETSNKVKEHNLIKKLDNTENFKALTTKVDMSRFSEYMVKNKYRNLESLHKKFSSTSMKNQNKLFDDLLDYV